MDVQNVVLSKIKPFFHIFFSLPRPPSRRRPDTFFTSPRPVVAEKDASVLQKHVGSRWLEKKKTESPPCGNCQKPFARAEIDGLVNKTRTWKRPRDVTPPSAVVDRIPKNRRAKNASYTSGSPVWRRNRPHELCNSTFRRSAHNARLTTRHAGF